MGLARADAAAPTCRRLPSLVDGRAANAAFPSLFGLQFRRLLWRRRAGPEDFGLQLWSMGLLVAVLALVFVA